MLMRWSCFVKDWCCCCCCGERERKKERCKDIHNLCNVELYGIYKKGMRKWGSECVKDVKREREREGRGEEEK